MKPRLYKGLHNRPTKEKKVILYVTPSKNLLYLVGKIITNTQGTHISTNTICITANYPEIEKAYYAGDYQPLRLFCKLQGLDLEEVSDEY